jgi:cobalt-zinc-cadmium efflux system outer membrane protein
MKPVLFLTAALALGLGGSIAPAAAQVPVSRAEAVDAALRRGSRLAIARADSSVAEALRGGARVLPDPTLAAEYTKSLPTHHLSLDWPLDVPWIRSPRIGAAEASAVAARARYAAQRAEVQFEAESLYAHAQAADAVAGLSRRAANDADSLVTLARLRRDAGDASELELELAVITAGQVANLASDDSLDRITALLEVQRVMGLAADTLQITLRDTLQLPGAPTIAPVTTLPVLAATASLRAAERTLSLEHGSVFGIPSLSLGVEKGDPGQPGWLPTLGVGLTLPLFDRRRGSIGVATAERDRATAQLAQARRDSDADLARSRRELAVARDRARRSEQLLARADRVVQLSLVAYQAGAATLPGVLEAVRSAREAQAKHIADLTAAVIAEASLRWLTATLETP